MLGRSARRRAIPGQFVTEAILLSFVGGLAGVTVGLIGTRFYTGSASKPVVTSGSVVLTLIAAAEPALRYETLSLIAAPAEFGWCRENVCGGSEGQVPQQSL